MNAQAFAHLSDPALMQALRTEAARDRAIMARLLILIGEVSARRLHRPAGYPSMAAFCVHELHMSYDVAWKRVRVAKACRRFPRTLDDIASGRLHLTAVVLLARYLTEHTAQELLEAGVHKSKAEVEQLLAVRFRQADAPTRMYALTPILDPASEQAPSAGPDPTRPLQPELASEPDAAVALPQDAAASTSATPKAPEPVSQGSTRMDPDPFLFTAAQQPRIVAHESLYDRVKPLSAEHALLQVTIDRETQDALRNAQNLLSHQLPSGSISEVLKRALLALVKQLEKTKFAATDKPRLRQGRSSSSDAGNPRYIPAHVKRAVWKRDQGQCTYVSDTGQRCTARGFLQFDHIEPVARGGGVSVDQIRVLCSEHNQHEAERAFGEEFMRQKREQAQAEARALVSSSGA